MCVCVCEEWSGGDQPFVESNSASKGGGGDIALLPPPPSPNALIRPVTWLLDSGLFVTYIITKFYTPVLEEASSPVQQISVLQDK